jgi:hypothetical protein
MCRDKQIDKEQILSIINTYGNDWVNEFHSTIENKIFNSNVESKICLLYAKYVLSSNSYEKLYHLAQILYKIIFNNSKLFEELFIYYYDIVFYTGNVSPKNCFKENKTLIGYYEEKDIDGYNELIKMTKDILSKDIFQSNPYKKINLLIDK